MSSRSQGRVDQGRREKGGRIENHHDPQGNREGDTVTPPPPSPPVLPPPTPPAPPPPPPPDVTPASVALTEANFTLSPGDTRQVFAVVENAESVALNVAVTFASSNTAVCTVDATSGLVRALNVAGFANITAHVASPSLTSAACVVTNVGPPPPPDPNPPPSPTSTTPAVVQIDAPSSAPIQVGTTMQISASVKNAALVILNLSPMNWTSSSPSVATVDGNGLVTARAAGTTTITAFYQTIVSNVVTVTVVPVPVDNTPASIAISPTSATIVAGHTQSLAAVVKNGSGGTVSVVPDGWHSSDATKATVNSAGLVTAVAAGAANITATLTSPSLTSNTSAITVTSAPSSGEPVYGDPGDTLLISERFTDFASTTEFWNHRNDNNGKKLDGTYRVASTNFGPDGVLITGPNGTDKGWQFTFDGVTQDNTGNQENHYCTIYGLREDDQTSNLNDGFDASTGCLIIQDWRRWDVPGGLNAFAPDWATIALKWMMIFQRQIDGWSTRIQCDTQYYTPDPNVYPFSCQWCTLQGGQAMAGGHQQIPPWCHQVINQGWFKTTFVYQPNTSATARDGVFRVYLTVPALGVTSLKIIDVSFAALGVVPAGSAGGLPWTNTDFLDSVGRANTGAGIGGAETLRFSGPLRWFDVCAMTPPVVFTVAVGDIKVWTRARIPKGS